MDTVFAFEIPSPQVGDGEWIEIWRKG